MQNSANLSQTVRPEFLSSPAKLWIFDFDETLTLKHTHKHRESGVRINHAAYENVDAQALNLRNPNIIKLIMEYLHAQGDTVSIASFHNGRDLDAFENKGARYIATYLKPLKLNFDLMIEAFKPVTTIGLKSSLSSGKNDHLQKLIERFNGKHDASSQIVPGSSNIFLIDDEPNNLKTAAETGIIPEANLIRVETENTSFAYLLKLVKRANVPVEALRALLQDLQAQQAQAETIVLTTMLTHIENPSFETEIEPASPKSPQFQPLFKEEIRRKTHAGTTVETDYAPNHSAQNSPKKLRLPSFLRASSQTPTSPQSHQTSPKPSSLLGFKLHLNIDSSTELTEEPSITRPTPLTL